MTSRKWMLVFFYLLFSCTLALNTLAVVTLLVMNLYLWVFHGIPFEIDFVDLNKYIKAASFSGSLTAAGSWFVYYRNYRLNRKRF